VRNAIIRSLALAALVAAAAPAAAQSLYVINPNGARIVEITGPDAFPPAGCPNGPIISSFPGMVGPCPPLNAFPAATGQGDIAVDQKNDLIYASDGLVINVFTPAGVQVAGVASPLFVTGLGIDDAGGRLWVTDGVIYGAVPLFAPGCGAFPPFVAGPWPAPLGPGFFFGPMLDLDWDPFTGTLMGCDSTGAVVNFLPGPLPVLGPYGSYNAGLSACGLPPFLTGIAIDRTLPGTGIHYVTDGTRIGYQAPGGAAAPPRFYTPMTCFPEPTGGTAGLAFAARQITYGTGADTTGLPAPTIGSIGQTFAGNPAYTMVLSGSVPGGTALLFTANNPFCPPFVGPATFGLPLYLVPPLNNVNTQPVNALGQVSFTVAIPPITPIGTRVNLQWWVGTGGSIQCPSGAHLTVSGL